MNYIYTNVFKKQRIVTSGQRTAIINNMIEHGTIGTSEQRRERAEGMFKERGNNERN